MVPWAQGCACAWPSRPSALCTPLENSRSLRCFVPYWKIPQKSAFGRGQPKDSLWAKWPTLCLETNLGTWEEEEKWGTFTKPLVLSFQGPPAGSGFKDHLNLLHLVIKTSPACQIEVSAQWKEANLFTQAARKTFLSPRSEFIHKVGPRNSRRPHSTLQTSPSAGSHHDSVMLITYILAALALKCLQPHSQALWPIEMFNKWIFGGVCSCWTQWQSKTLLI